MNITYSIFPKFLKELTVAGLAQTVRRAGLDTTNAVVRNGYWTPADNLKETLPAFVKAMRDEGLRVHFATTGYAPRALAADPSPLAIMAEQGITDFRMAYFGVQNNDVRASLQQARADLEALVPMCERYNIRAVYQVHHGTLIASASAAWMVISGLPSKAVGIELDPGNQSFEGMENWRRSALLLRDSLVAMGVKDTVLTRDPVRAAAPDKGWRRDIAPIDEGVTDWHEVMRALQEVDFTGTLVFMPFYHDTEPAAQIKVLTREVAYLRAAETAVCKER